MGSAVLLMAGNGLLVQPAWADDGAESAAALPEDGAEGTDPALAAGGSAETPKTVAVQISGPASPAGGAAEAPAMSGLEVQMLALVNGARIEQGLEPLAWDATIAEVARAHATEMMRTGTISHSGSDGSTPQQRMRAAGIMFQYGSENIWTYWGKTPSDGPSTMHAAMMAETFSPGTWNHIGNILYSGYKRIGIGIVVAPNGNQYLSEDFAD